MRDLAWQGVWLAAGLGAVTAAMAALGPVLVHLLEASDAVAPLAEIYFRVRVLGSLFAYVVSQNWDVVVFHRIRESTGGSMLWLRNIGSTATSQLLDTVIFTVVAFALAPLLLGSGQALPTGVIVELVIGQYLAKLLIALLDTPLVYATVSTLRSQGHGSGSTTFAD